MKSITKKRTWKAIYRLLDKVSPVDYDCGKLCGSVCCTYSDTCEEELGIYLYPGEEKLHKKTIHGLIGLLNKPKILNFPIHGLGKFIL